MNSVAAGDFIFNSDLNYILAQNLPDCLYLVFASPGLYGKAGPPDFRVPQRSAGLGLTNRGVVFSQLTNVADCPQQTTGPSEPR